MSPAVHQESFRIPPDHPCLAGHFPGNPVVPGVVVLDQVAAALARWRGLRLAALAQVKFVAPLLPGQTAELQLELTQERLRFRVLQGEALLASGEAATA
jgi:3-hydroxyacyl-[acyl-carrier-protein] dehydratase